MNQPSPPFRRAHGAMRVLAVGQMLLRRVACDGREHETACMREELIDDPTKVGLRDVFEYINTDHPVELLCR